MGVPSGGTNLGNAQGRISINTEDVRRAQQEVASASQQMQGSFGNLGGSLTQVSRFFGLTFGAATVAQLGRFAVEATRMTTAYERQRVAATNLAGSQSQLNDLLSTYDQATGGAIDKATALADVSRLLAVGFADTTDELEKFVRAARGISIATGQSQDYVISQLQLAIANQSTMRLDQLGLGVGEVKQRIDELRASNRNLTTEMAYQQAILGLAAEKFGALTTSAEGQADGVERAARAWRDLRTEMGQELKPDVDQAGRDIENLITWFMRLRREMQQLTSMAELSRMRQEGVQGPLFRDPVPSWMTSSNTPLAPTRGVAAMTEEQLAEADRFVRAVQDLERNANRDRIQATQQYEQQRSQVLRDYGIQIAREAEDFARQRARAEQDYAIALQRTWRDIAQREARQLEELERTITEARADAAERASERLIDHEERMAETRAATNARMAEMEADFAKRRERDQRTHTRRLRDAAANLDAVAIRDAQRDYAERQRDAQEDFNERIAKERANEAKRLAEIEKAYARQNAAEGKALQKRIEQANAAYVRQLELARAADAQRMEDMAADFALRLAREDEDRTTRRRRMAEDHANQLAEMARQQAARLTQIRTHAQEERTRLDLEHKENMVRLKTENDAWLAEVRRLETERKRIYDEIWNPATTIPFRPGVTPITPGIVPYPGTSNTRTSSVSIGQITIVTPTNFATDARSRAWLEEALADILDDYAEGR